MWLIILTSYLIAFGFSRAIEVIEPISVRLVSMICNYIQHANSQFHAKNRGKFVMRFFL